MSPLQKKTLLNFMLGDYANDVKLTPCTIPRSGKYKGGFPDIKWSPLQGPNPITAAQLEESFRKIERHGEPPPGPFGKLIDAFIKHIKEIQMKKTKAELVDEIRCLKEARAEDCTEIMRKAMLLGQEISGLKDKFGNEKSALLHKLNEMEIKLAAAEKRNDRTSVQVSMALRAISQDSEARNNPLKDYDPPRP